MAVLCILMRSVATGFRVQMARAQDSDGRPCALLRAAAGSRTPVSEENHNYRQILPGRNGGINQFDPLQLSAGCSRYSSAYFISTKSSGDKQLLINCHSGIIRVKQHCRRDGVG